MAQEPQYDQDVSVYRTSHVNEESRGTYLIRTDEKKEKEMVVVVRGWR